MQTITQFLRKTAAVNVEKCYAPREKPRGGQLDKLNTVQCKSKSITIRCYRKNEVHQQYIGFLPNSNGVKTLNVRVLGAVENAEHMLRLLERTPTFFLTYTIYLFLHFYMCR